MELVGTAGITLAVFVVHAQGVEGAIGKAVGEDAE